ncbi:glycosyltransferase, partial [Rhizobium ruizarguesonis]
MIVSLGRLERYKGHHRALDAFNVLATKFTDMRLRILGEGPYEA